MLRFLSLLSEAAASAVPAAADKSVTAMSLLSKGLVTTLFGLLGVFLVLTLFFVTIKLMQRIKSRENKAE